MSSCPGSRADNVFILWYLANPFILLIINSLKSISSFRYNNVLQGRVISPWTNPQPGGPGAAISLELEPVTCPSRLNLPGTEAPADIAPRITIAHNPPHHLKAQHLGRDLAGLAWYTTMAAASLFSNTNMVVFIMKTDHVSRLAYKFLLNF